MYALTNGKIFTGNEVLLDHAIIVDGQRIKGVHLLKDLKITNKIDVKGAWIVPGFIDLQLNGCGGVLFNDDTNSETLEKMHLTNLSSGTTSFLPTLITTDDIKMKVALQVAEKINGLVPDKVLGVHLEGPYLNVKRKGIHNESKIRRINNEIIDEIINSDVLTVLTVAPEVLTHEQVRTLSEQPHVIVSAGHSAATYEEAMVKFSAGISMVTHLYNAMPPLMGREPGLLGATLDNEAVYAGIICDGFHVSASNIRLAKKMKGEKLFLVTDAVTPVGTSMESFMLEGREVFYKNGKCIAEDGTIGGSGLTMIEGVNQLVNNVGVDFEEACRMASLYPAKAIGVDDNFGKLAPGYWANAAILNHDEVSDAYSVQAVMSGGEYIDLTAKKG